MKNTLTAVISDTHIGSWTGLSLHEWNCDTGEIDADGEPIYKKITATPAQDWLYEGFKDFFRHVWLRAKEWNARIVTIHVGDVVDGLHHNSPQSMPNVVDQEGMAVEILKHVANMSDEMVIIRGTEAHSGAMGASEVRIASELGALCVFEGLFRPKGSNFLIDVAHHGRAGRRDWTSAAAGMATQARMDALFSGHEPPRYVLRGHNHIVDDSGEKVAGTRAIALPSWQLRTAFGYRVSAGKGSDIGAMIILPDGNVDMSKIRYFGAPGQRVVTEL